MREYAAEISSKDPAPFSSKSMYKDHARMLLTREPPPLLVDLEKLLGGLFTANFIIVTADVMLPFLTCISAQAQYT